MINLQIEILEIFPSINELVENEDDNIILIMIIKGIQNVFNLSDIIIEQIPITLKIKEIKTIINIEIYRNENIIAEGDFLPFNDVKWLNIKFKSNYLNKNLVNLNSTIRMKFKCILIKENLLRNNIKKSKASKKKNLYNKSTTISSPRVTEANKKNTFHEKISSENIPKDNKFNKRKGKILLNNKSNEDNYFSQNTIYSQSSQISIDDSIQYNNPLCNSVSGISNLRKKSLDYNNNNKMIKRLNSQEETNRKKRKNQENKNNLITNNKTSTLSTRDSKEKLKNSNNISNFNTNNNLINKKFDDNFQSIDEAIIDKEFENEIALDEMINSNNKMKYNFSPRKINMDCSLDSVSSFNFEKVFNKESDDENEEIINCNFENLKNDFEIFYTQEYLNNISNDVIELEIQLLFEKIFEMQNAYHLELGFLRKKFLSFYSNYKSFSDKFIYLNKKFDKLKQKNKRIELEKNKFSFVYNNLIKANCNIIKNNKYEIELWKKMIYPSQNKKKILEIFNKSVLDKINERKLYLNNVEKFICDNFIKRFKIKVKEIGNKNDSKNENLSPIQLIKTQKHSSLSCPRKQNTNNQKTIIPYKSKLNTNK